MKKVLFITHYPGIGGANLSMLHLIKNLRDSHGVIPLVYLPISGPICELLDDFKIPYEIHRFVSWRTQDQGFRNLLQTIAMIFFNTFLSIKLFLKVRDFDVIYSNSSKVVFGAFLKFVSKKPLIWHLREFGTFDYPMVFLVPNYFVSKVYQYANVCIAISKEIESVYRKLYSPKANYKLVYNGVELKDYLDVNSYNKPCDVIRICMVGGFDQSKNQEELIYAISHLSSSTTKFIVDFFGDHCTEYGKKMMDLVKELGLTNIVTFKGQQSGLNKLLPYYHIGVISSKYEAFGRVIVEYMLSNLVVIAANTGACPELVSNGKTGLLYNAGDSEDLSNKLKYLLDKSDELVRLSKCGRDYAISHFTAEINANKISDIIYSL